MKVSIIDIWVYKSSLIAKFKKWFLKKKDPYLPLPKKIFLSPSIGIINSHKYAERKLAFSKTTEDPLKWQNLARKKLIQISGYQTNRIIPKVVTEYEEQKLERNVFKKSVYLRVREKTDVPVHLIFSKPYTEPCPVFIFLAGSSSGVHVGWGETIVPIDIQKKAIGADMGIQAAERGYVAVGIEQACYAERIERNLLKKSDERTIDASNHLILLGKSLMGYGASDVSSVVDWMLNKNKYFKFDKKRIFLFGHSSGGTLAQYASALDTRIKGTLASGSVGYLCETLRSRGIGSGDCIIPNFLRWFEMADLLALMAPRPFVGLSGINDHIFPYIGVKKVIDDVKSFYNSMGYESNINAYKAYGKHQYYSKETWEAWNKWIDPKL